MNTDTHRHPDPTTAASYAAMAKHVPAMRAKVHTHAHDAADEAMLVDALGLEVTA